ncbi:hypothetical protein B0H17DRAFT_1140667 [Mycena rosella]|uniref:Uncharacterized protein n=1 Tax=Mycena rosella TaxID=1033263 RepID=A0AAD7D2S3_MYCRO|nr:hypothetical protein B0H17DRAFT_1140667 [Mycena rosella]
MDVCDIHAILIASPSYRSVDLFAHDRILFGKPATVGSDLLDFQVHFPDSKLSKVEPRFNPWASYRASPIPGITAVDTQRTRYFVDSSAGGIQKRSDFLHEEILDLSSSSPTRIWARCFDSLLIFLELTTYSPGVKLDDLLIIDMVQLWMSFQYAEQDMDPSSKMPYLFLSSPAARFEDDGTLWLDIQPPDQATTGPLIPWEKSFWNTMSLPSSPFLK